MELMVVVAIIGMILSMAVPTVIRRLPAYRLNGAVRTVDSVLREARMQAMTEGRNVTCRFDIVNRTATLLSTVNPAGNRVRTLAIDPRVSWSASPSRSFVFRPDGTLLTSSANEIYWVYLRGEGTAGERWLVVWPSGVGEVVTTSRIDT
ncbi:MAG: hypothetical protein K9N49_10395 [Candidatus Marinimicrobia bacterium]|nr:hypothetical protein [Candidatus Neomarinimicrobiota bacterium]